jgi:hypothetical protein
MMREGSRSKESCALCLEGSTDTDDIITLMCNHKFNKRCIVGLLDKSVCPCCRARVGMEPYRYPARTALRNALLRAFLEYID